MATVIIAALAKVGYAAAALVGASIGTGMAGVLAAAKIGGAVLIGGALVAKKVMSLFEIDMPKIDTDRSRQATTKSTTEAHKVVYGESLVSGPIAFMGTAGTENRDLYYCIALAGHECEAITDIHFDNEVIPSANIAATSTNAVDVGTTGAVSGSGTFGPVGSPSTTIVQINKYLGTSTQDADIMLRDAFPSKWTVDHDGKGIAYIVTKWILNDDSAEIWDKYTPRDVKALVKGRKIYDPRLDTSPGANPNNATYIAWSDNPALCLADYLINDDFGMGIAAAKIDWDAIVTAANACDVSVNVPGGTEKRFTCNGVVFGTDSHRTNINKILSSMNGNLSYVNGKYVARGGIWEAGTVQLTEDDLTAPVSIKTSLERSDRFNTIKGVFLDPASNYKTTEFPEVQLADAVTRDSGEVLSKEIALNMTNSSYMAQRIANKLIQLTDQQKVIIFPANMTALRVAVGDRVQVTLEELSWSNKDFQCVGWSFNEEGGVNLTLREDSDQSYGDPLAGAYSQITSDGTIEDGFRGVPSPSALRGISSDDKVFLDWTNPGNPQDFETIHVFASSTNNFANAVKVGETDGSQFTVESNPGAGDASEFVENDVRYFWVRAIRFKGTSDQARSNIEPNNSTQGIEITITSISVSWGNVADPQVGITLDANDNIVTDLTDATASTTGAAVTTSGLETDVTIVEGGLTINAGGAIRSQGRTDVDFSTGSAGFYLGYETDDYKFGVGDSTNSVVWDGTDLVVTGDITADAFALASGVTSITDPNELLRNENNNAFFRYETTAASDDVSAPSDSEFNTAFGRNPRNRDIVIVVNTASNPDVSAAYIYNTSLTTPAFEAYNDFITGDLIVDGTVAAAALVANSISTGQLTVGVGTSLGLADTSYQPNEAIENGSVGGITITSTSIASSNFSSGSAGFSLASDGTFEAGDGTFRGAITATSLSLENISIPSTDLDSSVQTSLGLADSSYQSGQAITNGSVGGININSSALYSGSKSTFPSATTAGFILTSDGKIAISDGTKNVLSFDPTATEVNLNIQGSITAGSGSNTAALSGTEAYRFWAGSDNPATGTFRVDSQGQVVATNFILTDANNNILFSTADGFEPLAITQIAQGSGEAAKVTEYAESLTGDTDDIQITLSQTSNIQIKVRITCFWYGAEFAATDAAARTAAENELLQSVNLLVGYSATSGGAFTSSQNQSYTKVIDSATPTSTQINVETATSYDAESGTYLGTAVPLAGSGALNANKELIYTATFNNVAAGTYYVRSTVTATNDTATGSAGSASNNLKASNDSTYSRTVSIIDNTTDGGFTVDGGANQTVGGGDITSVSITANNGISGGGTVSSGAANFTLGLGAITPSSVSTTGTVTWDGGSSTNANTAFGWGDHSTAGYVTASSLSNYLPLAGGTMTGALNMGANAITSTGTISSGAITSSGAVTAGPATGGSGSLFRAAGEFSNDSTALQGASNVPLVVQATDNNTTAFGMLNQYGYQNFALNISGATNSSGDRGATEFYNKNNGSWSMFLRATNSSVDIPGRTTFSQNINNTSGALSFDTSKSILGTIHIANGNGAAGQPKHAAITFQGDSVSEAQAGIYVINDNSNGTAMALATTQSYATGPQIALEIDYNGNVDLKRGALEVGGTTVIDSSRNITATSVISGSVISGSGTPTGQLIGSVRSYGTTSAYMGASDESGRTAFFGVDSSGYAMFGALTNHDAVIRANNTEYLRVKTDSNVNVVSGGLQIGGTTVIDSSRNATLGSITGSSAYGGGTNDYTNVTTPPLKLVATGTSYIRVPHISQNANISTVYNYEAGKNVYWGEPGDTGAYYFRGRTFFIENNSTDPILSFKTTSTTADPVIQMNGSAGITEEGFEIWYDNTVGDVHFHTTYDNAAAAIRFHTRTGASKSTSNERFAITGDGDIQVSGTTRISSSGSFYPANIQGTSKISFLNGGNALGIRVESLYAGTTYANDGSAAGTVDTLNGYRVGGTTVIDSSRNVGGANLSASGTLSVGNGGYVAGMQVGALELGTITRDYNYTSGWSASQQSGILANCSENWEFVIHDASDALASPFAYFGSGSSGIGYFEMGRDLGYGAAEYYFRNGIRLFGKSANWSEVTPGTGVGTIHLSPIATDNYGSAITWGASDSSSGGTGQAGIYVRSDGSYGTKMYLATTDSYAAGSKVAISIQHTGIVALERNRLEVDAGGYAPDPTAKLYLSPSELQFGGNNNGKESNSGQISVGQHQANSLNFVGMSSGTLSSDRRMDFWVEGGAYFRGNLVCTGNVTAYGSTSDARLKTNVQKVIDPITKLQAVNGYTFDWNENAPKDKQGQTEYGVIAQEVEAAGLEELVFEYERPVNETGGDDLPPEKWKAVHYEKFVPILIEAVKGQQEQIEQLKAMIEELKNGDN